MITFKCKMCGGDLRFEEGARTCECEYCGSVQTLPKLDSGRRANLYDRANHFRRANEYDKAMGIYEQILQEDRTDAEAYWSLVLCRYGIEYVEDPDTGRRVPTVNRTQFSSILADEDYKSALEYADGVQRGIYENEAKAIDTIQKGILDISRKEEPFDVFICYKETDADGRRTPDSVLANDLYHALTREGFKVFFSRITLEDKLGQQYEPYIFAALNSAKVMVALGTKAEYFNAVWVKNEWSRYLSLIRAGQDKTLVPAYKDMDPYDLPEEFSHLQALDMGKLGFVQDLIHGIKKLARKDEKKADPRTAAQLAAAAEAAPLLKRAYIFMEDGDWDQASAYLERVLDKDPENADAYVGQVLVTNRMKREEELGECLAPYEESPGWQKALRFASPERRKELDKLVTGAKAARERARQEKVYQGAVSRFNAQAYDQALAEFKSIPKYKDAGDWIAVCEARLKEIADKKERERKNEVYREARLAEAKKDFESQQKAAELFESLGVFGDAPERAGQCRKKAENIFQSTISKKREELAALHDSGALRVFLKSLTGPMYEGHTESADLRRAAEAQLESVLEEEKKRKALEEEEKRQREMILKRQQEAAERKKKRLTAFAVVLVLVLAAGTLGYFKLLKPKLDYNRAVKLSAEGKFDEAEEIFTALGDYEDSGKRLEQINADRLFAEGHYRDAFDAYAALDPVYRTHDGYYSDVLAEAENLLANGKYDQALSIVNSYGYLDGADALDKRIRYQKAAFLAENGDYDGAVTLYRGLGNYEDSKNLALQTQADQAYAKGDLAGAADLYARLGVKYHTHAADYATKYAAAEESLKAGKYDEAIAGFTALGRYSNSTNRVKEAKYAKAESMRAAGEYDAAIEMFKGLVMYSDSADKVRQAEADKIYASGDYAGAYTRYAALGEEYRTHADEYAAMYSAAEESLTAGKYDEAIAGFAALGGYGDSADRVMEAKYARAEYLRTSGSYEDAVRLFTELGTYMDSAIKAKQAGADNLYASGDLAGANSIYYGLEEKYRTHADDYAALYAAAEEKLAAGKYDDAIAGFAALGTYNGAPAHVNEATYAKAESLRAAGEYDTAIDIFKGLLTYSDSADKVRQAEADKIYASGDYAGAYTRYAALDEGYRTHSSDYAAMYAAAEEDRTSGKYDEAIAGFEALGAYGDSADKVKQAAADKLFASGDYKEAYIVYSAMDDSYQTHEADYAQMYAAAEKELAEGKYDEAIARFTALGGYSDAELRVTEATYRKANALAEQDEYEDALAAYALLGEYRDSGEQTEKLLLKIADAAYADGDYAKALDHYIQLEQTDELKAREYDLAQACYENRRYDLAVRTYEMLGQYQLSVSRVLVARYAWANQLYENGEYEKAAEQFRLLGNMSDSAERAKQAMYMRGTELLEGGECDGAKAVFLSLGSYSDAAAKAEECDEKKTYAIYSSALTLLEEGKYDEAKEIFVSLGKYRDSDTMASECDYRKAKEMMASGDHQAAIQIFDALGSYNDSKDRANACRHSLATESMNAGDYPLAAERFLAISGYNDSTEQARKCMYLEAERLYQDKKYEEALSWYDKADGYGESAARLSDCRYQIAEETYVLGEYEIALSLLENETEDRSLALKRRCHFALGEAEAVRGNIPSAVAHYAEAVPDTDAQQRLYAIGADFAAVNENEKAIEVLWLSGDYEPSIAMLKELSGLLAASGRPLDAIMGYLALEDSEKVNALFGSVTREGWLAKSEGYNYFPAGDFRTEMKYRYAGMLMKQGKYVEAFTEYSAIRGYRDVDSLVANDQNLKAAAAAAELDARFSVGNYVTFGHYPQTAAGNDNTPIEWLVLARDGNKALLISRYALDCQPYNTRYTSVTWESCSLRTWLNGTFLNKAFTAREQTGIVLTNVDNGNGQGYGKWSTSGGSNTQDRVFLLSYAEANKYLGVTRDDSKNIKSRAAPTAYAIRQGAYTSSNKTADGTAAGWWWLRSPGLIQNSAAVVSSDSSLSNTSVDIVRGCVRPALWINLESGIF